MKKGGDDVLDKLAEPGKYLIRTIVQNYNGGRVIRMGGSKGIREFLTPFGEYPISFSMDDAKNDQRRYS